MKCTRLYFTPKQIMLATVKQAELTTAGSAGSGIIIMISENEEGRKFGKPEGGRGGMKKELSSGGGISATIIADSMGQFAGSKVLHE